MTPNFEAFADRICDLFFDDVAAVDYDEFLAAALATGVVRETVCDPRDPVRPAARAG
jgi:hypothetical protein